VHSSGFGQGLAAGSNKPLVSVRDYVSNYYVLNKGIVLDSVQSFIETDQDSA
jgi:hypothetical protein